MDNNLWSQYCRGYKNSQTLRRRSFNGIGYIADNASATNNGLPSPLLVIIWRRKSPGNFEYKDVSLAAIGEIIKREWPWLNSEEISNCRLNLFQPKDLSDELHLSIELPTQCIVRLVT